MGLHKDVVAYRVKKLQERGIIKRFRTSINPYKLGIIPIKFYFTFQYASPEIKEEIIDYFVKKPYTTAVHSLVGHYDLVVISLVKNISKFYNVWNEAINKFRNYFADQIFCVHNEMVEYKKTFLIDKKTDEEDNRVTFFVNANDKIEKIDDLDNKILDKLVLYSRVNTLDIAKQLNLNVKTINSGIQKMKKSGVITDFTININYPIIGYQWYKADIVLKDSSLSQKIIKIAEKHPNLIFMIKSLGYVDIELLFCLDNADQLHQIINDITLKFPYSIKNYKYYITTHT